MRKFVFLCLVLSWALGASAQEVMCGQGCRRGDLRGLTGTRAAEVQTRLAGGDFYTGDRHQLVVLAAFNDKQFLGDESETLAQWEKIFNQENYQEGNFVGSVHDYFYAQSYGQFNLTFDLQYVDLPESVLKYRSTSSNDENSQYLVNDVIDTLLTRAIDWGRYDWNGDGYVNQLMIIFPGKGMNDGGGSYSIWPHQWWLSQHVKGGSGSEYCERRTVGSGKETYYVDCYCALQEIAQGQPYGSFGTICHEYTHCFGLPDFYYGSGTTVLKEWDLMCYGNNNNGGFCPPNYSAHERWLMGWLTPTELSGPTKVTGMKALCDEPEAYLIRNDGYANEYYIVENRQQKGWDASLPGSGLVVFHVDYNADVWAGTVNEAVNSYLQRRYHIIGANNSDYDTSGWPYPYDSNDQLTNSSTPAAKLNKKNSDDSYYMNKPLLEMSVTDKLGSFVLMEDPTGISTTALASPAIRELYRLGPIRIVRCADGSVRKVY